LRSISWPTYEQIVQTLGEYHLRHTYDRGTLEVQSVLGGVAWSDYTRFLEILGDYPLRHTYDRGTLEMMAPRKDHDWIKSFLGRIVETVAFDFDINIQCIGSTTVADESTGRGFQPDEAYYLANEPVVRGKSTYEPGVDPPPDLLVEVDVTSSSVQRMPAFAALGIPEVWRYDGERLGIFLLEMHGQYREVNRSVGLPVLTSQHINHALLQLKLQAENSVLRSLLAALHEGT
jgi:Uma2 family endonuclease